jgi:hypothetical protein
MQLYCIMTKTQDRASRIRQRLSQIPTELSAEVRRMVRVREMVRGYVYHSQRRCGKPSCRCARGQQHEAWVIATKVDGKQTTRSLSSERRKRVQRLAEDYRRYRQAQGAVRKLCRELTQLGRELEGLICEDPFKEESRR